MEEDKSESESSDYVSASEELPEDIFHKKKENPQSVEEQKQPVQDQKQKSKQKEKVLKPEDYADFFMENEEVPMQPVCKEPYEEILHIAKQHRKIRNKIIEDGYLNTRQDQEKFNFKILEYIPLRPCSFVDASKGTMVGAFVGDALGAFVEFQSKVSDEEIMEAFKLQGKGPHNLGPGQVTDDSELAMCLAHGLVEGENKMDIKLILAQYAKWIKSKPFDIGFTIRTALQPLQNGNINPTEVRKITREKNSSSQSNGSLMRITPLAIWLRNMNETKDLETAVREEVILTHTNQVAIDASICYCIAIKSLINYPGNRVLAYDIAKNWAIESKSQIANWFKDEIENVNGEMTTSHQKGWLKIGFTYAFKYLLQNYEYEEALRKIIKKGGDTDTNAAIVGGLIGAAVGFKNIPKFLRKTVVNFDSSTSTSVKQREEFLSPKLHLITLIERLHVSAPESLILINGSNNDE